MKYLLDTHALIWFLNGDANLSIEARKAIESNEAINFVSIASLWEISIKLSLNRLILKTSLENLVEKVRDNNFLFLPITIQDTMNIAGLPFHHRDPFDRLLICQAINNELILISKDQNFIHYEVNLVW